MTREASPRSLVSLLRPTWTLTLCLLHQCRLPHTCGQTKGKQCWNKGHSLHPGGSSREEEETQKLEGAPASALWAAEAGVVSMQPGTHSLVGSVAVTDYFSQDPLLVPVHSLHSSSHLVSRFGHIVPRGWNGSTEGWGPVRESLLVWPPDTSPLWLVPALTCHQASRSRGAGSWLTAAAVSSGPLCAWSSVGAPSHCRDLRSWPLWEAREALRPVNGA